MDPIVAGSLITALFGFFGIALKEFRAMRRENRNDHGVVVKQLNKMNDKLDHVSERLDGHIDWHLKK
jgi:hypothetical protein